MKQTIINITIILSPFLVFGMFTNFKFYSKKNIKTQQTTKAANDSISSLCTIQNLDDFFYTNNGNSIDELTENRIDTGKIIKSISLYRFSTVYQKMILQDSLLLNRDGKAVLRITPYSSGFATTSLFYDTKGNRYLEIEINENKYDTIYTLRKFDHYNHCSKTIQYNSTRKEINHLTTSEISAVTDSSLTILFTKFEPEITHKMILPFESREMHIKKQKDSIVEVSTIRIVYNDTQYNSSYTNYFKNKKYRLIPKNENIHCNYNAQGNWIAKNNDSYSIERSFSYYETNNCENKMRVTANAHIIDYLYAQMDSLPLLAFKNNENKDRSFAIRSELFKNEKYGQSIDLKEGNTIESFLPQLWYQVSSSLGKLTCNNNLCYVVGYNTPIKNEDGSNQRCLAIYEMKNGKYYLIKQSYGAIDSFNDSDNDLLFDQFDETNFKLSIENGNIILNYEYMRGEASYEFAHEKENWILLRYGSEHRTCCQSESSSYDYKTKKYTTAIYNLGSDDDDKSSDLPRDTTITVFQKRPIMFMDSVTIGRFDYDTNE